MSRLMKSAGALILAIAVLLGVTASASGVLRINQRTVTLTSFDGRYTINTPGPRLLVCGTTTKTETIGAGGVITIPLGGVVFMNCMINGIPFNVVQLAAWTGQWTALLSGPQITGVLKRLTVQLRAMSVPAACAFTLRGTKSALSAVRATTPPALFSVSGVIYANGPLDVLGLNVENTVGAGCGALGIANGQSAGYTGALMITPALTGTLI